MNEPVLVEMGSGAFGLETDADGGIKLADRDIFLNDDIDLEEMARYRQSLDIHLWASHYTFIKRQS
jgi:hypothetical protein